eukprot:TRINITY_DN34808_c0_g1_i1.p1 TRINITY_DN34808_c0_g1~~TRINITY_DN34808_c0_g1_i1.p1  ORF type:complete len:332 (-),score=31.06 TRINITY_DN34808_c0_g1_i1:109-1104(-)
MKASVSLTHSTDGTIEEGSQFNCLFGSKSDHQVLLATEVDTTLKKSGLTHVSIQIAPKTKESHLPCIPFAHARLCPCRDGTHPREEHIGSPVLLAAIGLIRWNGTHILLTRRAPHMRSFPGAWVPPGGAVDPDEHPTTACAREIQEEVGLDIAESSLRLLGLWESTYPVQPSPNLPKKHHLIMTYISDVTGPEPPKVTISPDECDASCWFPLDKLHLAKDLKFFWGHEELSVHHDEQEDKKKLVWERSTDLTLELGPATPTDTNSTQAMQQVAEETMINITTVSKGVTDPNPDEAQSQQGTTVSIPIMDALLNISEATAFFMCCMTKPHVA